MAAFSLVKEAGSVFVSVFYSGKNSTQQIWSVTRAGSRFTVLKVKSTELSEYLGWIHPNLVTQTFWFASFVALRAIHQVLQFRKNVVCLWKVFMVLKLPGALNQVSVFISNCFVILTTRQHLLLKCGLKLLKKLVKIESLKSKFPSFCDLWQRWSIEDANKI